jgi:hypothetical protein
MVWVKCTTFAECNLCQVLVLQKCFWKNGERCRAEYSEGTAVAWLWFGVLVGYCQGNEVVMFD